MRGKEIDILAKRGHEKIAVEAKSGKQVITSKIIEEAYKKARYVGAKPKLKITRARVPQPARELAKILGVPIERVRLFRKRKK